MHRLPMRVSPHASDDGLPDGFVVDIVRDGITETSIGILFDNEVGLLHLGQRAGSTMYSQRCRAGWLCLPNHQARAFASLQLLACRFTCAAAMLLRGIVLHDTVAAQVMHAESEATCG